MDERVYVRFRSYGLPAAWAKRLADDVELLAKFALAWPVGQPLKWTQANGYRLADWVIEFFEGDHAASEP